MIKLAVFLLVLMVALVNSNKQGNFLPAGDEGEGNYLVAGDESVGGLIADSFDGDYFTVTRDVLYNPISAKEIELPTRFTRLSLNVGSIAGCRLVFSAESRLDGISGIIRIQEIRYSRAGIVICAIKVNPISVPAAAIRLQDGVGTNTATITLTSRISMGFGYRIQIYGKNAL